MYAPTPPAPRKKRKFWPFALAWVLLLIVAPSAAIGFGIAAHAATALESTGARTTGEIVDFISRKGCTDRVIVGFDIGDGETRSVAGTTPCRDMNDPSDRDEIGDTVEVAYDPDNPNHAVIVGFRTIWFDWMMFAIALTVGFNPLSVVVGFLWLKSRQKQRLRRQAELQQFNAQPMQWRGP